MLFVVLLLVVAAGGVLATSVLIGRPEWSWLSVLLSVLAAAVLVVERVRRRREASSSSPDSDSPGRSEAPARDAGAESGKHADSAQEAMADPDDEPAEEDTDAADALLVSESDDEVVVVDERPRYHVASCEWLGQREVLNLPAREARELGFTACGRCTPDAVLAGRTRATH